MKSEIKNWISKNYYRFDFNCIYDHKTIAENIADSIFWEDAINADYDEIYCTILNLL